MTLRVRSLTRERDCAYCGERFVATKRFDSWQRKFCSSECYREHERLRTVITTAVAATRATGARWGIHLKPEQRCRACRKPARVLHLHHAIPRSMCAAVKHDLRNGLPLCPGCHDGWHHRRVTIYRDSFTAEEWAFLSSVTLTGQLIGPWLEERYPMRSAEAA